MGKDIPVISCCKSDDFENIHFDLKQVNTIIWENNEDLKNKLMKRIIVTIEDTSNL